MPTQAGPSDPWQNGNLRSSDITDTSFSRIHEAKKIMDNDQRVIGVQGSVLGKRSESIDALKFFYPQAPYFDEKWRRPWARGIGHDITEIGSKLEHEREDILQQKTIFPGEAANA